MQEKIVLIDGHSILHRAFFGIPDLTNSDGLHTNAIYGFLNILFKILEEEKPDYLTVAFDVHAPTFRHKLYAEYKGTRKPMASELREQVPVMKEVLTSMGISIVEKEGYEADDILGTIAKRSEAQGMRVSLVSGDRDLLQLASEHIKIRIPKTKRTGTEIEDYYATDVLEKYKVTPVEFIDFKALMGDPSDNIPGVPSIGEKTASNLISTYQSIENAYAHLEEIKPKRAKEALQEHYDLAQLSKVLATIETNCDLSYDVEHAHLRDLYTPKAYQLFKQLEFKQFLERFDVETSESPVKRHFKTVLELKEADMVFKRAKACERIAFAIVVEQDTVLGAVLVLDAEDINFIIAEKTLTKEEDENAATDQNPFAEETLSSAYIIREATKVLNKAKIAVTLDLKSQLKQLPDLDVSVEARKRFFDVQIAAYLLNPLKNNYDYDDIAKEFAEIMLPSKADLLGKMAYTKALEEEIEQMFIDKFSQCVCFSAYTAYASYVPILEKLKQTGMAQLFYEIEMPLVFTLFDMECEGIRVNAQELKEYEESLSVEITQTEREIYEDVGETFNINSPKQLGIVLFENLKMPNGKKTKTGYSTAADVLDKLAPAYPVVSKILKYRQLTKLKSTYALGLANCIESDGRIHSSFNQTITATGRISSTEPNLQNIPIRMEIGRLIRKVFIPKEGYVFLDADYSQIELRVLAHMSGDRMLIDAYRQAQDIHRITASQVFHIPFEEVTDLQRRNAKAVNFGIVYGISSFGLSQDLSITPKEAAAYIDKYFETYPQIKQFLEKLVADAKEDGFVTTMFGRRRPILELSSSNYAQRSFGERIAMNSPIQGTAADIIKIAMVRVNAQLTAQGLKSRLILQVHDELLIETAKEEIEQVKAILEKEMESAADLAVALEVDMNTGDNWYDAH
ncbi:DNA polymerase I [Lachnospiraceae bacterium ZAX-1]